ncbi:putative RNA methyltransferase [Aurantivibrio plasticivorans]
MTANRRHLPWHCPVCQFSLDTSHSPWCCDNRHSFDVSKQGHVNLLLAHHKRSKNPGDSKTMLLARRQFLQRGYYQPLLDAIAETLTDNTPTSATPTTLLDSGCGEGYYLNYITSKLTTDIIAGGFDIAKDAVQMAAKQYPDIDWVCASSKNIPLQDNSIGGILNVFAPTSEEEFARILSRDGVLIVVGPGPQHLIEIKQTIYSTLKPYAEPTQLIGLNKVAQRQVTFDIRLDSSEEWKDLLTMTPFFHRGNTEAKQQLLSKPPLSLRCDFIISAYRHQ